MIEFISGIMIGGVIGIGLMCLLQINRDNELKNRINKAIYVLKMHTRYSTKELLDILGGDVDDE